MEKEVEFKFADPGQYTVENAPEIKFTTTPSPRNITFMNEGSKVIGTLSWDDDVFKFEGNAEESAQVFFDAVIKLMLKSKSE